MVIRILAVGTRMPAWVEEGWREYAKRLRGMLRLELTEIAPGRRAKGADLTRIAREEGARLLAAVPAGSRVIALDRSGRSLDTRELAAALRAQLERGEDLALLVGGPEGLSTECLGGARERWSLSRLTLAHPVVRVVLAEQLYRAWSILNHQPYHR